MSKARAALAEIERHADGPNEHTLCGLAFDAHESGDLEEAVQYAAPGKPVRCALCLRMIEHVYENFTKTGRVRPTTEGKTDE